MDQRVVSSAIIKNKIQPLVASVLFIRIGVGSRKLWLQSSSHISGGVQFPRSTKKDKHIRICRRVAYRAVYLVMLCCSNASDCQRQIGRRPWELAQYLAFIMFHCREQFHGAQILVGSDLMRLWRIAIEDPVIHSFIHSQSRREIRVARTQSLALVR